MNRLHVPFLAREEQRVAGRRRGRREFLSERQVVMPGHLGTGGAPSRARSCGSRACSWTSARPAPWPPPVPDPTPSPTAGTVPNATVPGAVPKLLPASVTLVPTGPDDGVSPEMAGTVLPLPVPTVHSTLRVPVIVPVDAHTVDAYVPAAAVIVPLMTPVLVDGQTRRPIHQRQPHPSPSTLGRATVLTSQHSVPS